MFKKHPKSAGANIHTVLLVIPTLGKRTDLLEQTLLSARREQPDILDIILVCPRNSIEAIALAHKYGADVADDPGTLSAALNVGFAHARPRHKYGCWMGDDDLFRPGCLNATTSALETHSNAVVAYGYCDYVDDNGNLLFTNKAGNLAPKILPWGPNLVPLIGMLYRISDLLAAGPFDEKLSYTMDLDMLLRLRKRGPFINTRKTLGAFRWHSTSTTVANRKASMSEAYIVRKRYLPKYLRRISITWEKPVQLATFAAAKKANALGKKSLEKSKSAKL